MFGLWDGEITLVGPGVLVEERRTMETTLFNQNGESIAYIADDDENSIYLWSGYAIAYIDGEVFYGWNGLHLGWFVEGIIYDLNGLRVGFIRDTCPVTTLTEPAKYLKHAKYAKYARHTPLIRPVLSMGLSQQNLETFLQNGAV